MTDPTGRRVESNLLDGVSTEDVHAPGRPLPESELALLRAYEPVICFTKGELFLPTSVGPYVAQCSLWAGTPGKAPTPLVPQGELSLERLCHDGVVHRDRPLFLRFVEKPLDRKAYARWRRIPRERLSAAARLTTTGIFGRLLDAGMRASLLLRGKVPVGLAAAAETTYREHLDASRFTYYGRVVRDGGYVCLQYWFFYAMNDWRSTFGGVNDHEADWEMVTIYLSEPRDGGPLRPAWVAFSSHDYQGDDLRRRWDDPELRREGTHPLVFAGAGSHSGAFIAGDYVVSVSPPSVTTILRVLHKLRRFVAPWRHYSQAPAGLGIPFVDYARGDGVAVGPGHDREWTPVLIDDETPWVRDYRGLWGLDTGDRFGGERAPSGPRYERDGSVRRPWANPLGWAGLLKVPPDDHDVATALEERIVAIDGELSELDGTIAAERAALRGVLAQVGSLRSQEYAQAVAVDRQAELDEREQALDRTIAARTGLAEERRLHLLTLSAPIEPEPPQAHIKHLHQPYVEAQERRTRFLSLWAVISTPLVIASIIVVLLATPIAFLGTIVTLVLFFSAIEAIARRRFLAFLASTIFVLVAIAAIVAALLTLHRNWKYAVSGLVAIAALALLVANVRALHRARAGRS